MLHFMGWHWCAADPEAAARVSNQFLRLLDADPRWKLALRDEGVLVAVLCGRHDRTPVALHREAGIVVGCLFQGAAPVVAKLSKDISRKILDSRGEALVHDYWGNYVAILKTRIGSVTLLRGPASSLPVLRDCDAGVRRFFSSAEIPAALDPATPTIDWPVFACSFMGPVASSRTALQGVSELLPGYAEHLSPNGTETADVWKPLELTGQLGHAVNSAEAARTVRAAVETCTRAYVAGHARVLHGLSGGLDSSVVLAALDAVPEHPDIICVTHYAEDAEGDERIQARQAALHTRARLIELRRREDIDLTRALEGVKTARPPGLRMPEVDRSEPELADDLGASVLMKGHGGDEVFCRNLAIPAAADCLRSAAVCRFLSLTLHAAVTEGVTFWRVLMQAASEAFLPKRHGILRSFVQDDAATSLLSPAVIDLVLNDTSIGARPLAWPYPFSSAKRTQVALTTGPRPYGTPHSRIDDANLCTPLLSQPVIEAALRLPTRLQFEKRGERAVLRNAFADVLSPEIIRRRSKGGAEILARRILNRNMTFIRELLLDGCLMRERIVDRQRLLAALSDRPAPGSIATVPVFDLLGAEIWLRRWLRT